MILTLLPTSGLCNRMRAIDSGLSFGLKYNYKIKVLWVRDSDLNCPFESLFQPIKLNIFNILEYSKLPLQYRLLFKDTKVSNLLASTLYDKVIFKKQFKYLIEDEYDFNSLAKHKRVFLQSLSRFYPNPEMYSLFIPIDELQEKINTRTRTFSDYTIGIHIRRTDHEKSIQFSPTELFIKYMELELSRNPITMFYLASDSNLVKEELISKFPDRIITSFDNSGRNSTEGIQEGLIDLYSLSKTRKILGSYYSSFSETAAHIGGIELTTVSTKKVPLSFS